MSFSTSENENPELYKNGGRSAMLQIFPRGRYAMKGGRSAMLQTLPLGGRSAMLQIFWGKGLQGGRSAIQHRFNQVFHQAIYPLFSQNCLHILDTLQTYCEQPLKKWSKSDVDSLESKELLKHLKFPNFKYVTSIKSFEFSTLYTTIIHQKMKTILERQNRSTEECSKLKRSVDMTSSGKNVLNIRTNASPKWDITRCRKFYTEFLYF